MCLQIQKPLTVKKYGINSCRIWHFVFSITNVIEKLKDLESCFYFYDNGLVDAIKTALCTIEYSEPSVLNNNVSAILYDHDSYLEQMCRNNSLPSNYVELWRNLELAIRILDQVIYSELENYLGDTKISIIDVKFMNISNDCIMTVER